MLYFLSQTYLAGLVLKIAHVAELHLDLVRGGEHVAQIPGCR